MEDMNIDGLGLASLNGLSDEELLGRLKNNPAMARKLVKAAVKPQVIATSANVNSREEFKARIQNLSPEIRDELSKGRAQGVDTYLSVVKSISGAQSIKMLKDSDVKTTGVCMINGAKMQKGEPFLLSAIILMEGVGSGTTENVATISPINFGQISSIVRGGHFEFKVNGKILIPETSNEVFANHFAYTEKDVTTDKSYGLAYSLGGSNRFGMFKLDNPKFIDSQVNIDMNIDWGIAGTTNAFLKAILIGTRVFKY